MMSILLEIQIMQNKRDNKKKMILDEKTKIWVEIISVSFTFGLLFIINHS